MEEFVETNFNTLSVEGQKDILKFLTFKDIISSRLVCIQWYRILSTIRPIRFDLIGNNSERLKILKQSFHSCIAELNVKRYTDILPICTSKRTGIPKAKRLHLFHGNSTENVMKLLRYYAKSSYGLLLSMNSLGKVEQFRLKGLSYEFLHYLGIHAIIPSNDWRRDRVERAHLTAIIQLMETTNLPNLEQIEFVIVDQFHNENQKFIKSLNTFLEKHGQKLTKIIYGYVPLLIIAKSLWHASNLQHLFIQFGNRDVPLPHQAAEINELRESFNHIKKLNFLTSIDAYLSFGTSQLHIEFIRLLLRENGKSIEKFCLRSPDSRIDWIPIDCEIKLKEVQLNFDVFREDTLIIAPNVHRQLKSVTKLYLTIYTCTLLNWTSQILPWIIATFPNLKKLSLSLPFELNQADVRTIFSNFVYLKETRLRGRIFSNE